jgi:hypothetical protein
MTSKTSRFTPPRAPGAAAVGLLAALLALGPLAGCSSPQASGEVTREATADTAGITSLSLVTDNAVVTVEPWPQAQVAASVRLRASGTSSADVQQRLDATSLALRRDGTALRVDLTTPPNRVDAQAFTLRLPAALALDLRTSNGAISVTGVTGGVELRTVNGAIALADATGRATLESTNGRIEVRLPAGAGADLDLETTNGSITAPGAAGGRSVRSAVGSGGPPITARSVNGAITVTRGS